MPEISLVNPSHVLGAAAMLRPVRARSVRRFVRFVDAGIPAGKPSDPADALGTLASEWQRLPPRDEISAQRRLAGEDVLDLLPHLGAARDRIAAWAEPPEALRMALRAQVDALNASGLRVAMPELHVADAPPAAYAVPFLSVLSLDRADALHFQLPHGIHVALRALLPLMAEMAVGHVLVHAALGAKSPEMLGRGMEEGVCEVLGAWHATSAVLGLDTCERVHVAMRVTPAPPQHRKDMLAWTRAAAFLLARGGVAGLAGLVREGRGAVKRVEATIDMPEPHALTANDVALHLALSRPLPHAVPARAFLLAQHLRAGINARAAAREAGLGEDDATELARELMNGPFVAVISETGDALVDDLDLVLKARTLRYDLP